MKTAIILTGALRTIKKTIKYLKTNILLNDEYHVFACIQNDTQQTEAEWNTWLHSEIGHNIKNIQWFSPSTHQHLYTIRENAINIMNVSDRWKHYLKTSGSIIEYFQLYIAYQQLCHYEQINNIKYDYIIRTRTDVILTKPIDFHWLNWTDEEVEERLTKIKNELLTHNMELSNTNTLKHFMATIISDDFIENTKNILCSICPSSTFTLPSTASELNTFIKTGDYILTIRANNQYIVKRNKFYLIPSIGFMYGTLQSPYLDGNWWWNAESQFQAACYNSGLTVFDYNTIFEDKSLYEYDEKRYFDSDYNPTNPAMLYCVVRN
jgi:hypothetical protein